MGDAAEFDPHAFRDVCFVIMPFGVKTVGTGENARDVDFDEIYRTIFEPAINAVELPESEGGGNLRATRTDMEFHTGSISQEMFEYIEYSRFALADITGLNANVFYELGARHRAQESGTAVFRQADAPIPFDINQIKAFPYQFQPAKHATDARRLVTQVLSNSLRRNAWDSPIRLALRNERRTIAEAESSDLQDTLMEAENAVRANDLELAARHWATAAELDPGNPLHDLKASYWPKSQGDWDSTIELLRSALEKEAQLGDGGGESTYSDAYRELGIAENKRDGTTDDRAGEESLRKAVEYDPEDYDAWSSLGGVLKRAGDLAGSLECYERAVEVSNGHAYPLLNAVKLRARRDGGLHLDPPTITQLSRAEGFRQAQVQHEPPIDAPWSFFDLAEIRLYDGDPDAAREIAAAGLALSTDDWMPATFLGSLELLPEDETLEGLTDLRAMASARVDELAR